MNNLEKLDSLQLVVNELVNSIKENVIADATIRNENIYNLEKTIDNLNNDSGEFKASYNIFRLKKIISMLAKIVKEQDKRITELESKKNKVCPGCNCIKNDNKKCPCWGCD